MKRFISLIAIFLCGMTLKAAAQDLLQNYIDSALKNNPDYQAGIMGSNALQQKIAPANTLPDPVINASIMNVPLNFSSDMMTMKQIGIQQKFSVSKKYSLKSDIARVSYEADTSMVASRKLWLINRVKDQYYDLFALSKKIETVQSSIGTLNSYLKIAATRYSTGFGTQQDILKAQLEITKMQDELIKMTSMKQEQVADFNTLLSRNPSDTVIIPDSLAIRYTHLSIDSLYSAAILNNPDLEAYKSQILSDSLDFQFAKTSKIPDFTGGIWYGQRQAITSDGNKAPDMFGISLSMNIPLYARQKQDPQIAEAGYEFQKTKYRYKAMNNVIRNGISRSVISINKNHELLQLYVNSLIPQAEMNVEAGLSGYQENKIDFLTLTDNFIALYNYRLKKYEAETDLMKAQADLEMLTAKQPIGK